MLTKNNVGFVSLNSDQKRKIHFEFKCLLNGLINMIRPGQGGTSDQSLKVFTIVYANFSLLRKG